MPDTREKWRQQTCKGAAEAKDTLESVVSGPCLSKTYPSGIFLLVGRPLELQLLPVAPLTCPPAHIHLHVLTHTYTHTRTHMHSASEVNL